MKRRLFIAGASPGGAAAFVIYKERNHKHASHKNSLPYGNKNAVLGIFIRVLYIIIIPILIQWPQRSHCIDMGVLVNAGSGHIPNRCVASSAAALPGR